MSDQNCNLVLEMKGITKRFPGVLANQNVDLDLHEGEVLALLGENGAGKSTLMNVLVGLYRQDEGEIYLRGEKVEIHSPSDAADLGIGMIHQNFKLIRTMTVVENIILGLKSLPFIPNLQEVSSRIEDLSSRYNLQVDPKAYIWQLSVGEQQRVEILKLLYRGADILILDEPTAVLTPQESQDLKKVLDILTSEGKSAIFITHKMEEVMAFSDAVLVLKGGNRIAKRKKTETTPQELSRLMVGREVLFRVEKTRSDPGEVVLDLENVHAVNQRGLKALNGIDLSIRRGEILGIAGVAGNGQDELAEVITGLIKPSSGKIMLGKQNVTGNSPLQMIKAGVSFVPADRIGMGTVGDMAVAENLAMKGYRDEPISDKGVLQPKKMIAFAKKLITSFKIITPTPYTHIKFLSGGNIQKAILAREIDCCSRLMIAMYPSRGLDVGATESVRKLLIEQRDSGLAVLLISEDLDELLSIADRIAVMFNGNIMGVLDSNAADHENLGLMMAGVPLDELEPA